MSDELNVPGRVMWFDDFNGDRGDGPTNDYRFLSNFYVGEPLVMPDGEEFPTGEHAYQAYKAAHREAFLAIQGAADRYGDPSPGRAKQMGNVCTLRPDWEVVKLDVMAAVVRCKFTAEREEGRLLLATADALLVEGTYWGDRVWGVDLKTWFDREPPIVEAPGRNWLGTMLMARRAELFALEVYGWEHRTEDDNAAFFGL